MSRYEVKQFAVRCDHCRAVVAVLGVGQDAGSLPLPAGWQRVSTTCYSSDHYYKDGYPCEQDWCPACSREDGA